MADTIKDTALHSYYEPMPLESEISFIVISFVIGVVLNSIILRCFFKVEGDIARYIRAFAVFDLAVIISGLTSRVSLLSIFPQDTKHGPNPLQIIFAFIFAHSMLGPLFLAMDRFLIVAFPHNFQLHEKKMRMIKIMLFNRNSTVTMLNYS